MVVDIGDGVHLTATLGCADNSYRVKPSRSFFMGKNGSHQIERAKGKVHLSTIAACGLALLSLVSLSNADDLVLTPNTTIDEFQNGHENRPYNFAAPREMPPWLVVTKSGTPVDAVNVRRAMLCVH